MSQGLRHSTQVQSQMVMEMHGVEQQKMPGLTMVGVSLSLTRDNIRTVRYLTKQAGLGS